MLFVLHHDMYLAYMLDVFSIYSICSEKKSYTIRFVQTFNICDIMCTFGFNSLLSTSAG